MIVLRTATEADGESIAAIYAPIVTDTAISFESEAPDTDEMACRIAGTTSRTPWLVCVEQDRILGYAYAGPHRARAAYRWSAEVSVYVAEMARGRGVGHGLYSALLAVLERQGFHRAFAGITLPNPASIGLHERSGFEPVGVYREIGFKFGAWHDVGWWQRELAPGGATPADPTPWHGVEADAIVQSALADGARKVRVRA